MTNDTQDPGELTVRTPEDAWTELQAALCLWNWGLGGAVDRQTVQTLAAVATALELREQRVRNDEDGKFAWYRDDTFHLPPATQQLRVLKDETITSWPGAGSLERQRDERGVSVPVSGSDGKLAAPLQVRAGDTLVIRRS